MRTKLLFISTFVLFALAIAAQGLFPGQTLKGRPLSAIHENSNNSIKNIINNTAPVSVRMTPTDVIYDSLYDWTIDATSTWKPVLKKVDIIYNSNKDITSSIDKKFESPIWVNYTKNTNTYDINYNKTQALLQRWDGNAWINMSQTIWTYVLNDKATSIEQTWNTGTNTWDNQFKTIFSYNNGNKVVVKTQLWTTNSWVDAGRRTYTYNSNNTIKNESYESYIDPTWIFVSQIIYSYDVHDSLVEQVSQVMDPSNNWGNATKWTRAYDNGNRILLEKKYNWDITNSNWLEIEKYSSYSYDSNNNPLQYFGEGFENGAYKPLSRFGAIYNSLSQRTDKTEISWDTSDGSIEDSDSTHYFIHGASSGIKDLKSTKETVFIYPNPSNGTFTINLENKRAIQNLEVYNVIGERILQQHQSNQVSIPNAQTGIYFVKIDDGIAIYTKKITVQ